MAWIVFKYALTAALVVLISEVAKRSDRLGALMAALPLVTLLTLVWLHLEGQPAEKVRNHATYTFWYVLPTLPMFAAFARLHLALGFWGALAASAVLTVLCFAAPLRGGFVVSDRTARRTTPAGAHEAHAAREAHVLATPGVLAPALEAAAPLLRRVSLQGFLWAFAAVCALIAWNRGLALLWGAVAFLLAALGLSHALCRLALRGVTLVRRLPAHAEAGQPLALHYTLTAPGRRHFVALHEPFLPEGPPALFVPLLPRTLDALATVTPLARGVHVLGDVELRSAWPLGLVTHRRRVALPAAELTVLPAMVEIAHLPLGDAPGHGQGTLRSAHAGAMDDFAGLREHRQGDPLKAMHWPGSARQVARGQAWLVKTFESFDQPQVLVVLNPAVPAGPAFEAMASLAASVARHACWQGWPVVLYGADASGHGHTSVAPHAAHLYQDLRVLAQMQPRARRPLRADPDPDPNPDGGERLRAALAALPGSNLLLSFAHAGPGRAANAPAPGRSAPHTPRAPVGPRTHLRFVFDPDLAAPQRNTLADGLCIAFNPAQHSLAQALALLV